MGKKWTQLITKDEIQSRIFQIEAVTIPLEDKIHKNVVALTTKKNRIRGNATPHEDDLRYIQDLEDEQRLMRSVYANKKKELNRLKYRLGD